MRQSQYETENILCQRLFISRGELSNHIREFIQNQRKMINDFLVELSSGTIKELMESFLKRQLGTVATIGHHGVEGIGYCDDPGHEGDFVSHNTFGITASVNSLMMAFYDGSDLFEH